MVFRNPEKSTIGDDDVGPQCHIMYLNYPGNAAVVLLGNFEC